MQRDTMLTQMYDIYFKVELFFLKLVVQSKCFLLILQNEKDVCKDILFGGSNN